MVACSVTLEIYNNNRASVGGKMEKTYKKLVANKYTRDFRDAGEVIEVEVPTPGPREVLLKNRYGGVNASDVNIAGGVYFSDGDFPFDLGCESIGEVIGIGSDVTEFALGDFAVSPELGSAYSELLCRDEPRHGISHICPALLLFSQKYLSVLLR